MKLCTECGAECRATAKFCTTCGHAFDEKEVVEQTNTYEEDQAFDINSSNFSPTAEAEIDSETETFEEDEEVVQVGLEDSLNLLVDYGYFFKETLFHPTSIFSNATGNWINGLLSVLILSMVLSLNIRGEFLADTFRMLLIQAVFVGALFAVNKLFSNHTDTFFDVLETYGGLIQGQILLFVLTWLVGESNPDILMFLLVIAFLNQLNILNLYLLRIQEASRFKLDNYYQLILTNFVFIILLFFMFRLLLV